MKKKLSKLIEIEENDNSILNITIRDYKYDLYLINNNKDEENNIIITKDNYFIKDNEKIISKVLLFNIKTVVISSLNYHGSYLEFNIISLIKNKKIKKNNDIEKEEENKHNYNNLLNNDTDNNNMNEKIIEIIHCYTPKKHRGKGIASLLATEAYHFANDHMLKVKPTCTYIKDTFLKLNSIFLDNTHLETS